LTLSPTFRTDFPLIRAAELSTDHTSELFALATTPHEVCGFGLLKTMPM
jgi:hypothetical protein